MQEPQQYPKVSDQGPDIEAVKTIFSAQAAERLRQEAYPFVPNRKDRRRHKALQRKAR